MSPDVESLRGTDYSRWVVETLPRSEEELAVQEDPHAIKPRLAHTLGIILCRLETIKKSHPIAGCTCTARPLPGIETELCKIARELNFEGPGGLPVPVESSPSEFNTDLNRVTSLATALLSFVMNGDDRAVRGVIDDTRRSIGTPGDRRSAAAAA